jgi:hypothetical protein
VRRRSISCLAIVLSATGCTTVDGHFAAHLDSPSPQVSECAHWYRALDARVEAAGVRDAQHTRVAGFPYLRVDRALASLAPRAAKSEDALRVFAERALELDIEARRHEIDNLPRDDFDSPPDLHAGFDRSYVLRRTRDCGLVLRDVDLATPRARAALLARAKVPDDYSLGLRALGLYPLTRLAFAAGVRRWQERTLSAFERGPLTPPDASRVRYAPPPSRTLPRAVIAGLLARAGFDALGQPRLSERELGLLAASYAPSFDIAVAADYDRFGRLSWRRGVAAPEPQAAEPAVYVQNAYARYGERVLLQIVYTLWFPERPAVGIDLLAGRLDGLVWRVTLAPDGAPLLYDAIHPCGCFHQFFPTPRARRRPAPDPLEEWAFVPQALPHVAEGERPVVSIASATHAIERVTLVRGADSLVRYAFRDYDELRSMQDSAGGKRSAFGPDGLIAGTERAERFLFWPMGIASAGAMRQWGRHATAFVGRRHFDDADLVERRFELDLEEPRR